jgi:hypothetical protein
MKRNVFPLIIMFLICGQLLAAVPTKINYQGRLTNPGGTVVPDANYSLVFTIYDVASGGTSKWTETQSVTTSGGLFAVLLGSVSPISDTVFNSATRYLGVKVGADIEMTPRTRLSSVPYADRVNTVDGSTGGAVSGNLYLDTSTTLTGNIYKSGTLFLHNGGGFANTCLGINSGNLSMAGDRNTAIGLESMRDNSTGQQNTAVGAGTLTLNTVGNFNTVTGFGALYKNTADENSAYGVVTLYNNTTGSQNTGLGTYALYFNETGDSNTACGYKALFNNATGTDNTATGANALHMNSSGLVNTAMGVNALYANTVGYGNSAAGIDALLKNSQGSNNAAFGNSALWNNTTGSGNTACGHTALQSNTTGEYNTAIGLNADVSAGNFTNATAIGYSAFVNASNKIRLGNTSVTVIQGQVAYTFTSDRNQKVRFQSVDGDAILRKIHDMNLTSWSYKFDSTGRRHYGPMAQEFFAAFGNDGIGQCGDSVSINSGDEAGILMIAVQALEKEKETLKAKVETIQAENAELKARLDRLEARLNKLVGNEMGSNVQLGQR